MERARDLFVFLMENLETFIRFQFSIIFVKTESLLSLNDYTHKFGMHTESTGMGICIVTVPSMGPM